MVDINMLSEDTNWPLSIFKTALTKIEPAHLNVEVMRTSKTRQYTFILDTKRKRSLLFFGKINDMCSSSRQNAGECFAPSLAGQKQPRQRGQQVKGPPASGTLRPSSRFFRWVSATPAKTALTSTSPWKDLPKDVVISEKSFLVARTRAKN